MTDCTLANNLAVGGAGGSGAAGGVGLGGGVELSIDSTVTITGTTFRGNRAIGGVGGAGAAGGVGGGGAVEIGTGIVFGVADVSSLTLIGCALRQNEATGGIGGAGGTGGDGLGGGLALLAGNASITSSTVAGNLAVGGAGSGRPRLRRRDFRRRRQPERRGLNDRPQRRLDRRG